MSEEQKSFKLAIGVPCTFPFVPSSFFYSFAALERPDFIFIHADNGPIDDLRNHIVQKALDMDVTHLIMMDVDMIYHPKTITSLMEHRLPVVGAMCFRRYPPFDSLILKRVAPNIQRYESIEDWKEGDLVECDATGTGCIMFDMDIFRDMNRRWQAEIDAFEKLRLQPFEWHELPSRAKDYIHALERRCVHPHIPGRWFVFRKDADTGATIGEDIGFCQELKAAGYKIFVNTAVPADHLTTLAVNQATSNLYRHMKTRQAQRALEGPEALRAVNE